MKQFKVKIISSNTANASYKRAVYPESELIGQTLLVKETDRESIYEIIEGPYKTLDIYSTNCLPILDLIIENI